MPKYTLNYITNMYEVPIRRLLKEGVPHTAKWDQDGESGLEGSFPDLFLL